MDAQGLLLPRPTFPSGYEVRNRRYDCTNTRMQYDGMRKLKHEGVFWQLAQAAIVTGRMLQLRALLCAVTLLAGGISTGHG